MNCSTQLSQLRHLIQQHEAPEAVFILATTAIQYNNLFFTVPQSTAPTNAYLLLVIADASAEQCVQMQSTLENILQSIATVTVWCIPLSRYNEQLQQGGYFACTVFKQAERLFAEPDAGFIPPVTMPLHNSYDSHWHQRALEFYAGAELFVLCKQYAMAAFLLHQCAEQCFTSIVYNQCGYRPVTNNLLLLYRYACWFQPLLHTLFPSPPSKEDSLLHTLQKAYACSRYTNEYSVKGQQLGIIREKMRVLLDMSCEP
ncbi:HEPN domain-containing protein [Parafilimonas sp.]|uniref:HEPN domain-containing protein n=1 Tax=Parafilimonas sp. TaxID=1969739 RepID=UPI0039E2C86E